MFYLYTEQITFVDSKATASGNVATDAEAVYGIAHRLMIRSLEDKAAHFLHATTNVENISSRTFAKFALDHGQLGEWYDEWFLGRWKDIRDHGGVEEVLAGLEGDWAEYVRVNKKFHGMIKRVELK